MTSGELIENFLMENEMCIMNDRSYLTAVKTCEKVYERSGKNLFWSIKNSGEILDKLKAREFVYL